MLISKERKFVFIHIPKTAGTSINHFLRIITKNEAVENMKTHVHARHVIQHLENQEENWQDYFFFSFVRNPFERLHSLYHFVQTRWSDKFKEVSFNQWLEQNEEVYEGRQTPPNETPVPNTRKPQLDWLTLHPTKFDCQILPQIIPSYIGRYENLEKDLELLLTIIDSRRKYIADINQGEITAQIKSNLPRLQNYNRDKDYKKYYSDEGRRWVEKYFEVDLDYFSYEF